MEELTILINFIEKKYNEINEEWIKCEKYLPLNMKKNKVDNIYNNKKLLLYVFNYRNFINDHFVNFVKELQNLNISYSVSSRVKALNSIQYKIENYNKNHENGKIPIKKCLNDLLGIRMIFLDDIDYETINSFITLKFPALKCIKSEKKEYMAVHIYFGNNDNKKFQWELQLWDKKHEYSNLKSHSEYKQDYTKWEQENM